ncbi:GNAT family N-acetyltransferase [Streptomyces bambusae]|nr:GNAT family N-acetyltransferase [Streptomyces bambusae]
MCGHVFLCLVERMPEPHGDNNPVGCVANFFVMPSQRNKGAGSALLEALKQHSRSAGLEGLIVWPDPGPGPAPAGPADDARSPRTAQPRLRPGRDHRPPLSWR